MAHFHRREEHESAPARLFREPVNLDPFEEDEDSDLPLTEEEEHRRARVRHFRFLASLGDFFGVILGAMVILLLIALLISLIHWVRNDMSQSFTLLQHLW